VQSQNISNKYTLKVEKYVRNDDDVSSQHVVIVNTFRIMWSGMDTILDMHIKELEGRNFEKN